jgi:GDP-L-fucose synthase
LKSFWWNKNVLVTGAGGFVGSHVVEKLLKKGANVRVVFRPGKVPERLSTVVQSIECFESDLEVDGSIHVACKDVEIILHLAASLHPRSNHGQLFYKNVLINNKVQNAAISAGVKHYLLTSTSGVYPDDAISPIHENEGLQGEPEKNQRGYGWAKRVAEIQAKDFAIKHGMNVSIIRPSNVYGPRDDFEGDDLFVIPSLINRIMKGEDPLMIQGGGKNLRAFLYVEDLVRAILLSVEKNNISDPINIAPDEEITIRELVNILVNVCGKQPEIVFDETIGGGRSRRCLNTNRAYEKLGFKAQTRLEVGLHQTFKWYQSHFNL